MKTLVTGGAGFLGSSIVKELIKVGKVVRVMELPTASKANIQGLDVEVVDGDVTDIDSLFDAVKGCDEIYHTAGIVSYWRRHRGLQERVNVDGTRNICQVALKSKIKRMVHTSSVAAIGFSSKSEIFNEESEFNQSGSKIGYVLTKFGGESVVKSAVKEGLKAVIVNPTTMFGEGDYDLNGGELIVKIAKGKLPAVPSGGMNFADVQDVAKGHILAMEKGMVGERYILGSENLTYDELFEIISDEVKVPPPTIHVPYRLALMLGYLGDFGAIFTGKYPNITPEGAKMTGNFMYYDSTKARAELGYQCRPIKDSIVRAVNFYREIGAI